MGGLVWGIFVASAILEVGGDALIRAGLRGERVVLVVGGFLILGSYGVLLNTMTWASRACWERTSPFSR